jgi:hypothetical protein
MKARTELVSNAKGMVSIGEVERKTYNFGLGNWRRDDVDIGEKFIKINKVSVVTSIKIHTE